MKQLKLINACCVTNNKELAKDTIGEDVLIHTVSMISLSMLSDYFTAKPGTIPLDPVIHGGIFDFLYSAALMPYQINK